MVNPHNRKKKAAAKDKKTKPSSKKTTTTEQPQPDQNQEPRQNADFSDESQDNTDDVEEEFLNFFSGESKEPIINKIRARTQRMEEVRKAHPIKRSPLPLKSPTLKELDLTRSQQRRAQQTYHNPQKKQAVRQFLNSKNLIGDDRFYVLRFKDIRDCIKNDDEFFLLTEEKDQDFLSEILDETLDSVGDAFSFWECCSCLEKFTDSASFLDHYQEIHLVDVKIIFPDLPIIADEKWVDEFVDRRNWEPQVAIKVFGEMPEREFRVVELSSLDGTEEGQRYELLANVEVLMRSLMEKECLSTRAVDVVTEHTLKHVGEGEILLLGGSRGPGGSLRFVGVSQLEKILEFLEMLWDECSANNASSSKESNSVIDQNNLWDFVFRTEKNVVYDLKMISEMFGYEDANPDAIVDWIYMYVPGARVGCVPNGAWTYNRVKKRTMALAVKDLIDIEIYNICTVIDELSNLKLRRDVNLSDVKIMKYVFSIKELKLLLAEGCFVDFLPVLLLTFQTLLRIELEGAARAFAEEIAGAACQKLLEEDGKNVQAPKQAKRKPKNKKKSNASQNNEGKKDGVCDEETLLKKTAEPYFNEEGDCGLTSDGLMEGEKNLEEPKDNRDGAHDEGPLPENTAERNLNEEGNCLLTSDEVEGENNLEEPKYNKVEEVDHGPNSEGMVADNNLEEPLKCQGQVETEAARTISHSNLNIGESSPDQKKARRCSSKKKNNTSQKSKDQKAGARGEQPIPQKNAEKYDEVEGENNLEEPKYNKVEEVDHGLNSEGMVADNNLEEPLKCQGQVETEAARTISHSNLNIGESSPDQKKARRCSSKKKNNTFQKSKDQKAGARGEQPIPQKNAEKYDEVEGENNLEEPKYNKVEEVDDGLNSEGMAADNNLEEPLKCQGQVETEAARTISHSNLNKCESSPDHKKARRCSSKKKNNTSQKSKDQKAGARGEQPIPQKNAEKYYEVEGENNLEEPKYNKVEEVDHGLNSEGMVADNNLEEPLKCQGQVETEAARTISHSNLNIGESSPDQKKARRCSSKKKNNTSQKSKDQKAGARGEQPIPQKNAENYLNEQGHRGLRSDGVEGDNNREKPLEDQRQVEKEEANMILDADYSLDKKEAGDLEAAFQFHQQAKEAERFLQERWNEYMATAQTISMLHIDEDGNTCFKDISTDLAISIFQADSQEGNDQDPEE